MTPSFTAVDALAEQRTVTYAPIDDLHPHPHNPRRDLGDLTELADSIRAHGIRQDLLVVPNPDVEQGGWRIVIGHRRHAAAALAGADTVPVRVDTTLDEIGQRELMLVENLQRTDLTPVEEGDAYQGLLDLGVSQAEISRQTGRSAKTVRNRLRLRTLPEEARAKVHGDGATLANAERLLDFVDHPEHLKKLTEQLLEPGFAHAAQRAADEVALATRKAEVRAELEAQGVRVIDEPSWDISDPRRLDALTNGETFGKPITPKSHARCPGHVVWVAGWNAKLVEPVYGCEGWAGHGHKDRYRSSSGGRDKGPLSEEEKAERRALVENNKAAAAAQKVREDWLIQFLARAKPPVDAATYVAGVFALVHSEAFGEYGYACRLFGYADVSANGGERQGDHVQRRAEIRKPARGMAYLMAIAAARVEKPMPKDFWRRRDPQVTLHLRTLASWGYPLSDLERTYLDGVQTELDVDPEQVEQ